MNLLFKIDYYLSYTSDQIRFRYLKLLNGRNFKAGINFNLKSNSRINIWGKKGKIVIGDSFSIGRNSELYTWEGEINIGRATSINDNCKIYGSVNIGSSCLLASDIFISSGSHNYNYSVTLPIKIQDKLTKSDKCITIEDDCWIGFGTVVLPGVYIGKGAIIGSNSVVTKDVFPYTVNAGIPCREINKRFDFAKSYKRIISTDPQHWPYFYSGCNYKQFDQLQSLEKGIQILDDSSVFLLSKIPSSRIKISGNCREMATFKVFMNNIWYIETFIESGPFDVELDLTNKLSGCPLLFGKISNDISNIFNVIIIEVPLQHNSGKISQKWAITSIEMV